MHVSAIGVFQLVILVMMCLDAMWAERVIDSPKIKSQTNLESILIDFCTTFHSTPLNGNHTGDQNGQFTFVSNQGNSVIDYFIVSVDLISKLNMNFVAGDRVESSHMPLQLNINSHPSTKGKTSKNEMKKESTTTLK